MNKYLATFYLMGICSTLQANVQKIIPVIVIGSGCAGLSAAMVTSEYGYHTVVFTGPLEGGDLNVKTEVGNWPGVEFNMGNKIIPILMDQAKYFNTEFKKETIIAVDFSKSPYQLTSSLGKTYYAQKVIIATGTSEKLLNIPGAQENRNYLFYNSDIHKDLKAYLAKCSGKRVAVIGGGIDAMKKAYYAAKNGASEVYIFTRENNLKMPPWRKHFLKSQSRIIKIIPLSDLVQMRKINNEIHLFFNRPGKLYIADLVVVSIGRVPRSEIFQNYVKVSEEGFIHVDAQTHLTNITGVFACGDVTDLSGPFPQAAIAAGNGQATGYSCVKQLLAESVLGEQGFYIQPLTFLKKLLR